jgi:acetylornithine/succinyldiaminopimelate/putrescine aminotransferase
MSQSASDLNSEILIAKLNEMRNFGGPAITTGLADSVIEDFLEDYSDLGLAIECAYEQFHAVNETHPEFLALSETDQIHRAQDGYTNFYDEDAVNPYVVAAGAGPWVVSLKGAVIYDCGGYGMLGLGHAPDVILEAMNQPHVMANIMTASVSQMEFINCLKNEIGQSRGDGTPFTNFLCLNSGSESTSMASRIADINTKNLTDPGARYEGCQVRGITLKGSFHGRTDRPARYSDSTLGNYRKHLASYQDDDYLLTVEPNNIESLEAAFQKAEQDGHFIEAFFMEPVMGEGNPGQSITVDFYQRARELTKEHGSMLVIDSIQSGLRAHGVLSIVDYPGFEELECPDMEAYSKALNAGQFPLSVLALSEKAASIYRTGLYGNTMTTNPRGLDVAMSVLEQFTPAFRDNIRKQGKALLAGLQKLGKELGDAITGTQGTGLLVSCELNRRYKCYGVNSTEDYLRKQGLGVIHGGARSLRYTPVFAVSDKEIELIIQLTRDALINGPKLQ